MWFLWRWRHNKPHISCFCFVFFFTCVFPFVCHFLFFCMSRSSSEHIHQFRKKCYKATLKVSDDILLKTETLINTFTSTTKCHFRLTVHERRIKGLAAHYLLHKALAMVQQWKCHHFTKSRFRRRGTALNQRVLVEVLTLPISPLSQQQNAITKERSRR